MNLLLKQAVRAVCAGMAGVVVLLLVGTQILDWSWIAAVVALSLVAGAAASRRLLPPAYSTAQEIDRRLGLKDTLSTALFYGLPNCRRHAPAGIQEAQHDEADRLAREVDLQRAIPFARPKSLYAMAALLLLASSLFALRYGFTHSLDLRPPLATIVLDAFHFSSEQLAAARKPRPNRVDNPLNQYGTPLDSSGQKTGNQDGTPGMSSETVQAERSDRGRAGSKSERGGSESAEAGDPQRQGSQSGQQGNASVEQLTDRAGDSDKGPSNGNSQGQTSASQQASNSPHDGNSLIDKFRDAMANLLSRLRSQPAEPQQMASNRPGRQDHRRSAAQNGNESAMQSGTKAQNGAPQGDQQGQGAEQAQSGPGQQGGSDADQATKQGQSGIGRQDGSKDVREAEQLAAMGKISEIIGRRSQNLTGEVMVEVASGTQELHTAYSQQKVGHKDSGGEIHRDEIPLAYQAFVQHYFDEIRKAPASHPKQP